ncbi:MAG: radical SAM protein [Bdellovibrionales bacterium]|nr:radical SAM protein [Bdellovibrionales bacterium]
MAFQDLLITEIFHSLQGETSLSGVRFAFIRLTGCNLRCSYCDSTYAFKGGRKMSIDQILETIRPYQVRHVLLTGGEPLLQRNTEALAKRLIEAGYVVSIETHGEVSVEKFARDCRIVMDIKTPSSRMNRGGYAKNLPFLKASDEIKFVIASEEDYAFARGLISKERLNEHCEVLLSPAVVAKAQPGSFPGITERWLAEKILEDRLPVRMQIQLHKTIWGADQKGV